jgi:hypothetical protein
VSSERIRIPTSPPHSITMMQVVTFVMKEGVIDKEAGKPTM